MKKLIIFVALLCLLAGCSASKQADSTPTPQGTSQTTIDQTSTVPSHSSTTSTQETTSAAPLPITFTLYYPDEQLINLEQIEVTIDSLQPELIVQALQKAGVLNADVCINSATVEGEQLNLDFNEAFLTQIYSLGCSGEGMLMGSLVNTFLSAYGCERMMVTVDGEIIQSGHVDYDFPMYGITDSEYLNK